MLEDAFRMSKLIDRVGALCGIKDVIKNDLDIESVISRYKLGTTFGLSIPFAASSTDGNFSMLITVLSLPGRPSLISYPR